MIEKSASLGALFLSNRGGNYVMQRLQNMLKNIKNAKKCKKCLRDSGKSSTFAADFEYIGENHI